MLLQDKSAVVVSGGTGRRGIKLPDALAPYVPPSSALTFGQLIARMRTGLTAMSSTPQTGITYASGAQYFVRPVGAHGNTQDGLTYNTAWLTLAAINWGLITPNTTLWVCGVHDGQGNQLNIQSSGTAGNWIDIRLDNPTAAGEIYTSRIVTSGEWTASGVNGEYYLTGIVSPLVSLLEDGVRLFGPSPTSRVLMNITDTGDNATTDTITHGVERPFVLGSLVWFPASSSGGGTGTLPAPLARDTAYYSIPVSSYVTKLATSYANAIAGTAIDLTTNMSGVCKVYHENYATHQDPVIGSLLAGQYAWDAIAQRLYYKPTSGTPSSHVLRLSEDRWAGLAAAIFADGIGYVRIFGGGQYGGIFGTAPVGKVGLCQTNVVQLNNLTGPVRVDGIEVFGGRSGVAVVGGSGHVITNCRVHDVGWHGLGSETPLTVEDHNLFERNWVYDVGKQADFGDVQGVVINTHNYDSIARRNLIQRVGRNHAQQALGTIALDTSSRAFIYRNVLDECYGVAIQGTLGSNPGDIIDSVISSNIFYRNTPAVSPLSGVNELSQAPIFLVRNQDPGPVSTHTIDNLKIFGNLVAGANCSVATTSTENASVLSFRVLTVGTITNVSYRKNAILDLKGGGVYGANLRTATSPDPTWTADYNLIAGITTSEFARLKKVGSSDQIWSKNYAIGPGAGYWSYDTGRDVNSTMPADYTPVNLATGLPNEALEFLRDYDTYDTLNAPVESGIGNFPFS